MTGMADWVPASQIKELTFGFAIVNLLKIMEFNRSIVA